jgi:hypothetical protein
MLQRNGMTTQFEASLRNGAAPCRTAPFPNDPPTAVTFPIRGASLYCWGLLSLRSMPTACQPNPTPRPTDSHGFTHSFTQIYTNLHTHLHRFTQIYTPIYTPCFFTTISGPISYKKARPEAIFFSCLCTFNPVTDRRKRSQPVGRMGAVV